MKTRGTLNLTADRIRSLAAQPATAKINYLLLQFLVYGFIGWLIETAYILLVRGHFSSRGLLAYGIPLIPLFGYGGTAIIQLIKPYRKKPVILFLAAAALATLLELLTGLSNILLLNHRTWNYDNMPLSLNGHIALPISLAWGLILLLIAYFLEPKITCMTKRVGQLHLAVFVWPLTFVCFLLQAAESLRLLFLAGG